MFQKLKERYFRKKMVGSFHRIYKIQEEQIALLEKKIGIQDEMISELFLKLKNGGITE